MRRWVRRDEIFEDLGRSGEIWGDLGRSGEMTCGGGCFISHRNSLVLRSHTRRWARASRRAWTLIGATSSSSRDAHPSGSTHAPGGCDASSARSSSLRSKEMSCVAECQWAQMPRASYSSEATAGRRLPRMDGLGSGCRLMMSVHASSNSGMRSSAAGCLMEAAVSGVAGATKAPRVGVRPGGVIGGVDGGAGAGWSRGAALTLRCRKLFCIF